MKTASDITQTSMTEAPRGGVVPDWGPVQGPPVDEERIEDAYDLRLGTAITGPDGRKWLFIGWRENSAGRNAWFVREVKGFERGDPLTYNAAFAKTLENRFPDATRLRR